MTLSEALADAISCAGSSLSVKGAASVIGSGGGPGLAGSGGIDGTRHFPSAFWAQTTSGLINEISLITRRCEKRDPNLIRSRKVFAVRKSAETPGWLCGMVMPLSFSPHHGVTLIWRTCSVVPSRWLSSC